MDFRQTIQPNPRPSASGSAHDSPAHDIEKPVVKPPNSGANSWIKVLSVALLATVAALLCVLAVAFGRGHNGDSGESKLVNTGKYQAVFLNNGQVYFGNVTTMNDKYIRLANVYYLTQTSTNSTGGTSSNNYTLVKLGCQQIHDPYDAMVINRSEVSFWENLKNDGQVVASINKFKQQPPNGPDCSQVSSQTQATSSNTQGTNNGSSNGDSTTK